MHYYKRNIGDYAKKAGRLTMMQHGSYTLLIDACYDREKFPTLEEAIAWTWASTKEECEAVYFVLQKFFLLENGIYVQKRIQEEVNDYHSKAEINKRIAIERETKRKENNTNRSQLVNEPTPNHKPLTINQEQKEIHTTRISSLRKLLDRGVDEEIARDWMVIRKAKKLPLTETAIKQVEAEAKIAGLTFGESVAVAVRNGWAGYKSSWEDKSSVDAKTSYNQESFLKSIGATK